MRGLLTSIAVVALLSLGACPAPRGSVTAAKVGHELLQGGADVARDCGPKGLADYAQARAAIHQGGIDWLTIALDAGDCIVQVVKDERAQHAGTLAAAGCASISSSGCVDATGPESPGEIQRMRQVIAVHQLAAQVDLGALK